MLITEELRKTLVDFRDFLAEDWEALKASPSRFVEYCKKFHDEAEAGKQAYDEDQARQWHAAVMTQQALVFQTELNALKKFWACTLSQMHTHHNFWGHASAASLRISFDGVWHLNLPASVTANQMPPHFHNFRAELTETVKSVRQYALEELRDRIQADVDLWQDQQIDAMHTGVFRGKSDAQLRSEYARLYHAVAPLLCRIDDITVVPSETGVEISFAAVFDDAGLSPDRYYDNVNLLM